MVDSVAEDIYQVRLPLPFALNSVNCYLLRDSDGWTLIDSGINTPDAREVWRAAFAELNMHPADITRIILTHTHPDHFGLVGWVQSLAPDTTIPVYTSAEEIRQFQRIWAVTDAAAFGEYLRVGGVPESIRHAVAESFEHTMNMTYPSPARLTPLPIHQPLHMGGSAFQVIQTPGHSDGHLIFYAPEDKLMLSGDHVLMKITPNIGLWADSLLDPLGDYLDTLAHLHTLDVTLALPGHKTLITDWRGRIEELQHHHHHRLDQTLNAVTDGCHVAYDVAFRLFDTSRFTVHEWRFAIAETLAHLEYLRLRDRLTRDTADTYSYSLKRG